MWLADMVEMHLYVLNHSVQRIHFETFFFACGLVTLAVVSLLGTTSVDMAVEGLGFS